MNISKIIKTITNLEPTLYKMEKRQNVSLKIRAKTIVSIFLFNVKVLAKAISQEEQISRMKIIRKGKCQNVYLPLIGFRA